MKIIRTETLFEVGDFAQSEVWGSARARIYDAILSVDWPAGSGKLTIYPEIGKKRGKGNGVKPIKLGLREELAEDGWTFESRSSLPKDVRPGPLDALIVTSGGVVAVEWETGNISSSHRALNKLVLGMLDGVYAGGILVVPSKSLAQYLTDRVGNFPELVPYFPVYRAIGGTIAEGILEVVEAEHDATSWDVPKMPKGTDGRALG